VAAVTFNFRPDPRCPPGRLEAKRPHLGAPGGWHPDHSGVVSRPEGGRARRRWPAMDPLLGPVGEATSSALVGGWMYVIAEQAVGSAMLWRCSFRGLGRDG